MLPRGLGSSAATLCSRYLDGTGALTICEVVRRAWRAGASGLEAMRAGGAIVTQAAGMQPGVNCALYALGVHIGFSAAQSVGGSGGHAVHPGMQHVQAAETLLKLLSGDNGPRGPHLFPFWRELLPRLGFTRVADAAPGDCVVYTARAEADSDELAIHYGVVRNVGERGVSAHTTARARVSGSVSHVWVESKHAVDESSPTHLHPLHVVDPTFLLLGSALGVHFYRPPPEVPAAGPAATARLYRLAAEFEQLAELRLKQEGTGRIEAADQLRTGLRGSIIQFEDRVQ